MTPTPQTARPSLTLDEAKQLMQMHRIRHLPILDAGKLVGILTERAIRVIESINGADLKKIRVEDAMEQSVYVVPPNAGVDEVVMGMTSRRYGSAVVMRNREVLGIFTLADACVAYVDLLNMRPANA
jgi:acetoin utilization protein AcuB